MSLNRKEKLSLAFLSTAFLAACGGGGDTAAPAPAPATTFTSANATSLIGAGAYQFELIQLQNYLENVLIAGIAQAYSTNAAAGSGSASNLSCVSNGAGSGSFNMSVTKAGTYVGLLSGDRITLVFNNCRFGTSTSIQNGTAVLTANSSLVNAGNAFNFSYTLSTTGFSPDTTISGVSTGTTQVNMVTTSAGIGFPTINSSVPSSYQISYPNGLGIGLSSGSTIRTQDTSTGGFSNALNGNVTGTTSSGSYVTAFATSTNWSAPSYASSGRAIPTAGASTMSSAGLYTSVVFSGSVATVGYNNTSATTTPNTSFNTTYLVLAP